MEEIGGIYDRSANGYRDACIQARKTKDADWNIWEDHKLAHKIAKGNMKCWEKHMEFLDQRLREVGEE